MMITPGASAISALLGGPSSGESGTAGPAGLLEPFSSFLAAATVGESGLGPSALPAPGIALGEFLAVPLDLAGEQPPALESLSALFTPTEDGQQAERQGSPDPDGATTDSLAAGAGSAASGVVPGTVPTGPADPTMAPQAELRSAVPGISFPAEAAGKAPATPPIPIVEPVAQPVAAAPDPTLPSPSPATPSMPSPSAPGPVPLPAVAPAGPPATGQAAQQAGLLPGTDTGDAPEPPRPIAAGIGMEGAPAFVRAAASQAVSPAPALMDATIQRIVAIAEQTVGTSQRAMVVELPDTDGARLLVSMRGEAVHVTVASPGSGLPGQAWLTELATALTTRGFVPEGLLADGNGGRRSPYQPQDDQPPPGPSQSAPKRTQPDGLSL